MDCSSPEVSPHEPVLLKEVLTLLDLKTGQVVVDGTLGSGGHAREILKRIGPQGRLIGMDQDPNALKRAQASLKGLPNVNYVPRNFSEINQVLSELNLKAVDAVLLDVGLSTEQLEEARRGFSFLKEGPLDMRMNPETSVTAGELVNDLSQGELEGLFRKFGEERWGRRIAKAICREREAKPIQTTTELAHVIESAVPPFARFKRLHPATRVFQALRIEVNRELEALESALPQAFQSLRPLGRMAVISFHSLEDRIVKNTFRTWAQARECEILTRKPIEAGAEEVKKNPRSRSAKLRAIKKVKKQ